MIKIQSATTTLAGLCSHQLNMRSSTRRREQYRGLPRKFSTSRVLGYTWSIRLCFLKAVRRNSSMEKKRSSDSISWDRMREKYYRGTPLLSTVATSLERDRRTPVILSLTVELTLTAVEIQFNAVSWVRRWNTMQWQQKRSILHTNMGKLGVFGIGRTSSIRWNYFQV